MSCALQCENYEKDLMGDIDGSDSDVLGDESDEEVCPTLLMRVFMCMVRKF